MIIEGFFNLEILIIFSSDNGIIKCAIGNFKSKGIFFIFVILLKDEKAFLLLPSARINSYFALANLASDSATTVGVTVPAESFKLAALT